MTHQSIHSTSHRSGVSSQSVWENRKLPEVRTVAKSWPSGTDTAVFPSLPSVLPDLSSEHLVLRANTSIQHWVDKVLPPKLVHRRKPRASENWTDAERNFRAKQRNNL
jgi:hypothetical protein